MKPRQRVLEGQIKARLYAQELLLAVLFADLSVCTSRMAIDFGVWRWLRIGVLAGLGLSIVLNFSSFISTTTSFKRMEGLYGLYVSLCNMQKDVLRVPFALTALLMCKITRTFEFICKQTIVVTLMFTWFNCLSFVLPLLCSDAHGVYSCLVQVVCSHISLSQHATPQLTVEERLVLSRSKNQYMVMYLHVQLTHTPRFFYGP
jgi:hypothetical protein